MILRCKINFRNGEKFNEIIIKLGAFTPFEEGLYASTEMLSDGYIRLFKEKIVKKRVYDDIGLQQLLNLKLISEDINENIFNILQTNKLINSIVTAEDILFLQRFGIISHEIRYENNNLLLPTGEKLEPNLALEKTQSFLKQYLGKKLKSGKIIHAGFFLGSADFYHQLFQLSRDELEQIEMTSVERTNTLNWSFVLSQLQRQNARFINSAMMATLEGSIISDGLRNWQEVSGVGGQFDFASMVPKLVDSRFIINCRSTWKIKNKTRSNIVWQYPNTTIPRHLRDIIITEYGIADCRSKTDADVIKEILNITDSRFQENLLKQAKKFGKINSNYEIPNKFQNNLPQYFYPLLKEVKMQNYFKSYPFGSELTEDEQVIQRALLILKNYSKLKLLLIVFFSYFNFKNTSELNKYLKRMELLNPKNIKDYFNKKVLIFALQQQKSRTIESYFN